MFSALDWLAQMVRYCLCYSNKARGMRKNAETDDQVPALAEAGISL